MPPTDPAPPVQSCQVFMAAMFRVTMGVNSGDPIGGPDDASPGDVYMLHRDAVPRRLVITREAAAQHVAAGSGVGRPGAEIALIARHTLMAPDGDRVQILVLRTGAAAADFVLPMSPLEPSVDYTLVRTEDAPQDATLADFLCVSFARGTMITLGSGAQCAIEALTPGTRILTRDHGPQPLRWRGHATLRAVGAFAPVVITAGTMGNSGDLTVSQHHRMFLYLRDRAPDVARAELLVQARHLVDGGDVYMREGGMVDWFSLVFDSHEIVYAEGIPAESLMVNAATLPRLPEGLADEVRARFPGLSHAQHVGFEAGQDMTRTLGLGRRRPK